MQNQQQNKNTATLSRDENRLTSCHNTCAIKNIIYAQTGKRTTASHIQRFTIQNKTNTVNVYMCYHNQTNDPILPHSVDENSIDNIIHL